MSYYLDRHTTFTTRMNALLPSPSPQPMLHFEILFESMLDLPEFLDRFLAGESLQHDGGGVPEAVVRALEFIRPLFPLPCHRASADVAAGEPLCYDAVREAVGRAGGFLVLEGERRDLSEFVCEEVQRSFPGGALPENAVLSLCFGVRTVYRLGLPAENEGPGMVPAAASSFGMLKKYEVRADVEEEEGKCCAICLEKLGGGGGGGGGGGALSLPCDHVFHDDCIKEWLRKSHFCPLCRYEMPTQ